MLMKIVLVVSLATLAVSLPRQKNDAENELITSVLGTGSNLIKGFSKVVTDDADKFSVDLNALYKKYEISNKAEQAKLFFESQFKILAESINDNLKKSNIQGAEELKKFAETIKAQDPVLGDKLLEFNKKSSEMDKITEDIVKYVLETERINGAAEKLRESLHPIEHKLAESIKKFETIVLENLPKRSKQ